MRIGMLGVGAFGAAQARHHQAAGHQVVALYDRRSEVAQQVAKAVGAKVAASFEALLQDSSIDLIHICLPTDQNRLHAEAAARAGKHILVAAPIALTLEEAEAMMETARENGVHLLVTGGRRHFPEYQGCHRLIQEGKVGEPGVVRTTDAGPYPEGCEDWYAAPERSGGLLLNGLIQEYDWLRWTFGEVERVYAKGLQGRTADRLDYGLVTLRFTSGVIAHVEGSWSHTDRRYSYEVAGNAGLLEFDSAKVRPVALSQRTAQAVIDPERLFRESPYAAELRHYGACITQGSMPQATAVDGCKALEIALAAQESARTGQPVRIGKGEG